jgi:hypothetical protein
MKWTVEIEVADNLVADGLDLTERRVHDALSRAFPYARVAEFKVKILTKPDDADVAEVMGFASAEDYRFHRR